MREDVARILNEEPASIRDDDNLIDLGLDSVRAMALVQRWNDAGAGVDFSEFAVRPELGYWWELVSRNREFPPPQS